MKKILIISNDQIFIKKKKIYSNFNDTINIIQAISENSKIYLLSRITNLKQNFFFKAINFIKKTDIKSLFQLSKNNKFTIFIISITPRNFLYFLIISLFFKKIKGFIYLRSNGHVEYQKKLGKIGHTIYDFMFKILSRRLKVISVSKTLTKKKIHYLITPSEIDSLWFKDKKKIKTDIPRLLYFGRFKVEKGVFSLLKIIKNMNIKFSLTIAGDSNHVHTSVKYVKFKKEIKGKNDIIRLYDKHNIFILPSYTEGSPKVILESLSRLRPVIVFTEIKHVKYNLKGVFVCNRNPKSFERLIKYILLNYNHIQKKMKTNKIPTKEKFQRELIKIIK